MIYHKYCMLFGIPPTLPIGVWIGVWCFLDVFGLCWVGLGVCWMVFWGDLEAHGDLGTHLGGLLRLIFTSWFSLFFCMFLKAIICNINKECEQNIQITIVDETGMGNIH